MKKAFVFILLLISISVSAQKKTIAQIKKELEESPNPPLYVKDVLKKKFRFDTVAVMRTRPFMGLPDSLAYHGKIKKVYGPYDKGRVLVQILAKLPNNFNRISQIFLDTKVYMKDNADSIANEIMAKIKDGRSTFEEMAQVWSMGGEEYTKGDLGWIAVGALVPEIERELVKRKKGEVFKVSTANGVHILKKTADTKQDTGFALMMRVQL